MFGGTMRHTEIIETSWLTRIGNARCARLCSTLRPRTPGCGCSTGDGDLWWGGALEIALDFRGPINYNVSTLSKAPPTKGGYHEEGSVTEPTGEK